MRHTRLKPEIPVLAPQQRAGVLLPLPLAGAYDYKLPMGVNAARGALVAAPLGNRETLGVVWGAAEGTVGDNRLKIAEPLEGAPALPPSLCDFIDWVAAYTLNPPGAILAMALRSRQAFEPETKRIAYVKGEHVPSRLSEARKRVLAVAEDGLARSVAGLAEDANVSPAVVRGLIAARRRHRIGEDRSLFRGGGRGAAAGQADTDPAAGNRLDHAVPGTLRRTVRREACRMA